MDCLNSFSLDEWVTVYMQGMNVMCCIFSLVQLVKQAVLPRVHGLALKTTVAAVCTVYIVVYLFGNVLTIFNHTNTH